MKTMRRAVLSCIIAIVCGTLIVPPYLFADSGSDVDQLREEIALLKEQLNATKEQLNITKERLNSMEARINTREAAPAPAIVKAGQSTVEGVVTAFAKEIEVHGGVDTSYVFNTNTPVSPNPQTNNLRVFDREANGFTLNMAQINFEKLISKESPVGFRVDLDFGNDAKFIHAAGLGNANDEFDLQQAYAQIMLPWSWPGIDTLSFKIGKFVTLHGAEVIESWNNWNFSRSFLFGYAIPFTHTGVRMYYKPFANIPVETYLGVVNGWDVATDNNRAKSLEAMIAVTPTDKLSFSVAGMAGAERADSNKDLRNLIDIVATYKATDKLTLKANYDYGWEANGASDFAGYDNEKNASWSGIALYAKYDIKDWWSIAGRCEYFDDADGVRTGFLTSATMPISDVELFEYTLTNEFRLWNNFITRLEYRYDKANGQVFLKDKVTANNQSTISAEVIYKF